MRHKLYVSSERRVLAIYDAYALKKKSHMITNIRIKSPTVVQRTIGPCQPSR